MLQPTSALVLKVSKHLSDLFNPMNSLIVYFIIFSIKTQSLLESAKNFLHLFFIIILPISLWIYYHVKNKKYTDADVSDRTQRKSLYFFIAACMVAYLMFIYFRQDRIDWVAAFLLLLLLIVLQISNYFIKSSMHTALNIFVAALFLPLQPILALMWFCIAIIVGITRVVLKRHTIAEVLSGSAIASFISFIYLYIQIQ